MITFKTWKDGALYANIQKASTLEQAKVICTSSTIHTAEFLALAFIENKILLERTTQLAEIAWIKSKRP